MSSISDITDFVTPVAAEATKILGVAELGGTVTPGYVDPLVLSCAVSSFTQVESFLRRRILQGDYTERHLSVKEEILLKHTPVIDVTELRVRQAYLGTDAYILVPNIDWVRFNNEIHLSGVTIFRIVEIDITGGWSDVTDDANLFNGLLAQTIATFNRKETLGLTQLRAGGGTSAGLTIPTEAPQIVENARMSLDPLVYYGTGDDLK
jgi:hypothetical protein